VERSDDLVVFDHDENNADVSLLNSVEGCGIVFSEIRKSCSWYSKRSIRFSIPGG
jgi:hypothetical protein